LPSPGEACPRDSQSRSGLRATWRLPLLRAQRALETTVRRLRRSLRSIEAGERFVASCVIESDRQLRALRPLGLVPSWLASAEHRLTEAQSALRSTAVRVQAFPDDWEDAGTEMIEASIRMVELVVETGALFTRLSELSVLFAEKRAPGGALAYLNVDVEPELSPALLRRLRGDEDTPVTHRPYQPPINPSATAFRRVSRGRAPPALLFPTL
jgi:hypothetical protein